MAIGKISPKYQVTVPTDVRAALGLKAGDTIQWDVHEGVARVRKVEPIDWLFLKGVEASLAEEWLSPADMEAWRDL